MRMAGELSKFAVFTRYPFESSPIVEKEYTEAVKIAQPCSVGQKGLSRESGENSDTC